MIIYYVVSLFYFILIHVIHSDFFQLPQCDPSLLKSNTETAIRCFSIQKFDNKILYSLYFERALLSDLSKITINMKVRKINFALSDVGRLSKSPFFNYTGLQILLLDDNNISEVMNDAFDGLENLRTLSLRRNKIKELPETLFMPCPNLIALNLSQNLVTNLSRITRALSNLRYFQSLNLTENDLSKLMFEKELEAMVKTNLKTLDLSQCNIDDFYYEPYKSQNENYTIVKNLFLKNNKLVTFPKGIFKYLNLVSMDISITGYENSNNVGFCIACTTFTKNSNLEHLAMDRIRITYIERDDFSNLTNLKTLFLRECEISKIDDFAFISLKALEILKLNNNKLLAFGSKTFTGLSNLKELDLTSAYILQSSEMVFQNLPRLEHLILSRNQLFAIHQIELQNLLNLKILNFNDNRIQAWKVGLNPSLFNLSLLSLKRNAIFSINAVMLHDFSFIKNVDISDNPFNCSSCEMQTLLQNINTKPRKFYNQHDMRCAFPQSTFGKSIFNITDFQHCSVPYKDITLVLSVTLSVLFTFVIVVTVLCHQYRWRLAYIWFLTRAKIKHMHEKNAEYRFDAFVSYSEIDRPWVLEHLIPKLEEEEPKLRLCLHERDFVIGEEIMTNIINSIGNSYKTILLLSNNFLKSHWCMWETNIAQFIKWKKKKEQFWFL